MSYKKIKYLILLNTWASCSRYINNKASKVTDGLINGEVIKQYFFSDQDLRTFISNNNLGLTYQGCLNC